MDEHTYLGSFLDAIATCFGLSCGVDTSFILPSTAPAHQRNSNVSTILQHYTQLLTFHPLLACTPQVGAAASR